MALDPAPALHVADDQLHDLRTRLARTRWPTPWPVGSPTGPWDAGVEGEVLRRLVDHWQDGFDWRRQEAEINALPRFVTELSGVPTHVVHLRPERAGALPIVLTHGWPSTFLELVELGRRLATPSQHGGRPEDAFEVVIPSLPGFPLSPQRPEWLDGPSTADLWHELMHERLGFPRYAAHGGDLGAGVTSGLGQSYPQEVVGIHLLAVADPSAADDVTAEEQVYLDEVAAWYAAEGGYEHEQQTKPLTLAHALADSPVGLLAWLLEKYHAWVDGDLSARFSDDALLTQASLYWFDGAISTSFRPYFQYGRDARRPIERVTVPTAVAVFPGDLVHPPRSWAERVYAVERYTRMPRGGHFAAHEEPALLAGDITAFFRDLRS